MGKPHFDVDTMRWATDPANAIAYQQNSHIDPYAGAEKTDATNEKIRRAIKHREPTEEEVREALAGKGKTGRA